MYIYKYNIYIYIHTHTHIHTYADIHVHTFVLLKAANTVTRKSRQLVYIMYKESKPTEQKEQKGSMNTDENKQTTTQK